MTTIHARQIRLTKMHVMETKKVLYIISNIFYHHIAVRTFCLALVMRLSLQATGTKHIIQRIHTLCRQMYVFYVDVALSKKISYRDNANF
jgi:hypothetical protein